MNSRKWLLSIAASLLLAVSATVTIIWACNSSPRFACSQTAWLAKIVTSVVVVPPGASTATVNMTLVPNVRWSVSPAGSPIICPQPTAAEVILTLTFPGLAPQTFTFPNLPVPTVQGAQPPIPVSLNVTLPPGGVPAAATVVGQYRVTFTGAGGGLVIGLGDAKICFVPPSPVDPNIPRLGFDLVSEDENQPFQFCQRGDTTCTYYLITNNDPECSVRLEATGSNTQIAFTPGGDAPGRYGVSGFDLVSGGDVPGSDNFSISFFNDPLLDGNPMDPNDPINGPATTSVVLGPWEQRFLKVNTGIHGMCANGSCSEQLVEVVGEWFKADAPNDSLGPALGCAQTAIWVDDLGPAKTPLCTITDEVKTVPGIRCAYETAMFGDAEGNHDDHFMTLPAVNHPVAELFPFISDQYLSVLLDPGPFGNTDPGPGPNGEWLLGDFNRVPTDKVPHTIHYVADCTNTQTGHQTRNTVHIYGFDNLPPGQPFGVPVFEFVNGSIFDWQQLIDIQPDGNVMLTFLEGDFLVYEGPFAPFCEDPPFFINCDPNVCRTFTKHLPECSDTLGVGTSSAAPHVAGITALLAGDTPDDTGIDSFFDVFFEISETPAPFEASLLQGAPTTMVTPEMGGAGTPLQVTTEAGAVPVVPGYLLQKVRVENLDTCNQQNFAYIALRKLPPPPAPDSDGDGVPDDIDNAPDVANPDQSDLDGDVIGDVIDNAVFVANPGQEDSDNDGTGDVIDGDFDNDGTVTFGDFNVFRSLFGTVNTHGDFDTDGVVGISDLNIFIALFGRTIDRNTDPFNP